MDAVEMLTVTTTPSRETDLEQHVDKKLIDNEERDVQRAEGHDSFDEAQNCECLQTCMCITKVQNLCTNFLRIHGKAVKWVIYCLLFLVYIGFFITACYKNYQRATPLIVITAMVIFYLFYGIIRQKVGRRVNRIWQHISDRIQPKLCVIKLLFFIGIVLVVIVVIAVIIGKRTEQYVGLAGISIFIIMLYLTSHNPAEVKWRPVLWGILLNFMLAVFMLKTYIGVELFRFLADAVTTFLKFTDVGAAFVFGRDTFSHHFFAFKILPTIVFFSCVISLLYYVGAMQFVIQRIAFVMESTMGTSATESLSCAGNIFVGQTEAPILIRPFLPDMTKSELHAVMTGGFATIAGGVLAAYVGLGIDAVHLICASVMNAPMALALSKLTYPETETSTNSKRRIVFAKPAEQNLIEAAAAGASQSIGLVANIAANLIAFLSLLAFVNAMLSWLGSLVDYPDLSFELICSYLFWIFPLLMGVDYEDCLYVAELLGRKLVINEFVAYEKLGVFVENRNSCVEPYISKRSEIISTYALCGFANLSSIGIQLGGIGAMAPTRSADIANLAIRALIAGTITNLITASLAGMLITDYDNTDMCQHNLTTASYNYTQAVTTYLNITSAPDPL